MYLERQYKKVKDMKIVSFKTGFVSANTYIVYDKNSLKGFIIDPGGGYKRIIKEAHDLGVTLQAQLLTHGHFDHCGASAQLQEDGIEVYIHSNDAPKVSGNGNLAHMFNLPFANFSADKIINDGDILNIAGFEIKVLHTPGHSSGSVCYICGQNIFSGDTLFNMSVGRSDFPDGNANTLNNSIKEKLFKLSGDYNVYPGHDQQTTLDYERNYNPMIEWDK